MCVFVCACESIFDGPWTWGRVWTQCDLPGVGHGEEACVVCHREERQGCCQETRARRASQTMYAKLTHRAYCDLCESSRPRTCARRLTRRPCRCLRACVYECETSLRRMQLSTDATPRGDIDQPAGSKPGHRSDTNPSRPQTAHPPAVKSPPCAMKPLMIRWKAQPLKVSFLPLSRLSPFSPVQRARKFWFDSKNRQRMVFDYVGH